MSTIHSQGRNWLAASTLLLAASSSYAVESAYSIYAEGIRSDNISRVAEENKQSDTEAAVGANVRLYSNTRGDFRYDVGYDARYVNYIDDTFDDETELTGRAVLEYFLVPEFFSWNLIHRQTRTSGSARTSDNPDDLERRTTWQTGPSVFWNPTAVDVVEFSGIFSKTSFENTESADTERKILDVSWSHRISPIMSVRTFIQAGNVEFDNIDSGGYDYTRYGVGFARQLRQWQWDVDVGGNTIERETGSDVNGFFLRGAVNYQEGRSYFTARASQEVTDNSIGLGVNSDISGNFDDSTQPDITTDIEVDGEAGDTNFNIQDIVERTSLNFIYRYDFLRSDLMLNVFWDQEDFEVVDDDQTVYGFGADWILDLSDRSSLTFDASIRKRDFDNPQFFSSQRNLNAGIGYRYRLGENWNIYSRISRDKITREDAPDNLSPVEENRFLLRVSYDVE